MSTTTPTAPAPGQGGRLRRLVHIADHRPLMAVVVVAAAVRLALAVVVFVGNGGVLFGDDINYGDMAAAKVTGRDVLWDPYTRGLYGKTATFTYPLTWLYDVFGVSRFVGQCFVVAIGVAVAGVAYLLARRVVSPGWALVAGLAVAVLPSQVLWSSLVFKDPLVWLVSAGTALALFHWFDGVGRRAGAGLLALVVLLVLLGWLRTQTLVVSSIALLVVALLCLPTSRRWRAAVLVPIAVLVPMAHHLGPGGWDFVTHPRSLSEARLLNARGARTAIVKGGDGSDAEIHAEATGEGITDDLGHLPSGLVAVLLRPFPGESTSPSLLLAGIDSIPWYALLVLAAYGLRRSLRAGPAIWFLVLLGAGMLVLYALVEGNIGTAYRHRSETMVVVVLLATAGAERFAQRRRGAAGVSS